MGVALNHLDPCVPRAGLASRALLSAVE